MGETEKAQRYISQLDAARCNGDWHAVPELARKLEKHAPHRKCLSTTARAEAKVATADEQRPGSPNAAAELSHLPHLMAPLLEAAEQEKTHLGDRFQAETCLGSIHWELGEASLAIARLPKIAHYEAQGLKYSGGWLQVCLIKAIYLRGSAEERLGHKNKAASSYAYVLPHFISLSSSSIWASTSQQTRFWTERVLARFSALSYNTGSIGSIVDLNTSLLAYHIWKRLWKYGPASIPGAGAEPTVSRRTLWDHYYLTLSAILRLGLLYDPLSDDLSPRLLESPEGLTEQDYFKSRLRQRAELKEVEAIYESLLLKNTRFPKATERNYEIEAWVDKAMRNWSVLCGPHWKDEELGEGGKDALGRGVLEILYRAATKAFHSTQILRHLFVVHASLADFDLSMKAFDSYVELVQRGKDRAEKSGETQDTLDDDDTVLGTAAAAIRILCRHGARAESEKARNIGTKIEQWLKQPTPASETNGDEQGLTEHTVKPETLVAAHCAVGISRAHWARYTYEAQSRSMLQRQAYQSLLRSLEFTPDPITNLDAMYALAVLLAETRDINGAIKTVKRALATLTEESVPTQDQTVEPGFVGPGFHGVSKKKLAPFWHLLSLLLTVKGDFEAAAEACEAALDQLQGPDITDDVRQHDEQLNGNGEKADDEGSGSAAKRSLASLDTLDKWTLVQIKMTDIALIEVIEDSGAAVDATDELLALYAAVFGDPKAGQLRVQESVTPTRPPKSSGGTFRGSILGRVRRSNEKVSLGDAQAFSSPSATERPSTRATDTTHAPTIQVTNEHGNSRHSFRSLKRRSLKSERPSSQRTPSVRLSKSRPNSMYQASIETAPRPAEKTETPATPPQQEPASSPAARDFRSVPHNMPHEKQVPPAGHEDQPPHQDARLPVPFPDPEFKSTVLEPHLPTAQERKQQISLLIEVWLFISGLYVRGALLEDAKGAVDEASALVTGLEAEVAQVDSSSRAFAELGWGGGKSVEALRSDVHTARGELAVAQGEPHEGLGHFEQALLHSPDHPGAIVNASNIMLDIYRQVIPAEHPAATGFTAPPPPKATISASDSLHSPTTPHTKGSSVPESKSAGRRPSPSPEELNRLAARDRAYGLLTNLTKLGSGWDDGAAWYALANVHEESGQLEKAKECLWWCVELEDTRPLRAWTRVGAGGSVL